MVTGSWSEDGILHALAELVARAGSDEPGPMVPWSMLEDLAELIPSDEVALADLDMTQRVRVIQQCVLEMRGRVVARAELEMRGRVVARAELEEPGAAEPFWRHYGQFYAGQPPSRAGQVRCWTDSYGERELRRQPLYCEYFRPGGVKYFLGVGLAAPAGHERNLLFFRSSAPDFTERDKDLLRVLRPHLVQIDAAAAQRRAAVLTPREWQVLELAAEGHSNAEIGAILFTSVGTVRKHMEHIFDRAGVRNRNAAVARLMPATGRSRPDPARPPLHAVPGRGVSRPA